MNSSNGNDERKLQYNYNQNQELQKYGLVAGPGSSSASNKRTQLRNEYSSETESPPLTEDSGQWSCSFPSSPIKEQSPHGSTTRNVKSSSGSTSSCEYNNNSRKSNLYGTPHWWPINSTNTANDDSTNPAVIPTPTPRKSATASKRNQTTTTPTKERNLEMATTTPIVKHNRALAFTINFHDTDADDKNLLLSNSSSNLGSSSVDLITETETDLEDQEEEKVEVMLKEVEQKVVNLNYEQRLDTDTKSAEKETEPVGLEPVSDVKSDNGTYTLDDDESSSHVEEKRADIQLSEIDNNDWIQKWASEASAHVPDLQEIPPYDDTFKILDETRSIVNAIQNRVASDRARNNNPKLKAETPPPSSIKFNRAFNIRRNLNTATSTTMSSIQQSYDSDNTMTKSSISDKSNTKQSFARADGGRFSLRVKKGAQGSLSDTEVRNFPYTSSLPKHTTIVKPNPSPSSRPLTNSPVRSKSILGPNTNLRGQTPNSANINTNNYNTKLHARSNSTITSRDIEMENWKRRKSYDPLKAAGMGVANKSLSKIEDMKKRDFGGVMEVSSQSQSQSSTKSSLAAKPAPAPPPSSTSSLPRHQQRLQRMPTNPNIKLSGSSTPIDHGPGPTTSASASSSIHSYSPTPHDPCCGAGEYVRVHDWIHLQQQLTRNSTEQTSPRKFEALDTLVISTIFSLTNKVRNLSLGLLKKIHPNQEDDENSALIEEMITQLNELGTQQLDKHGQKSSSKELSGILKNVKKIEQVILVLDRVLCDQDDSSCED